MKCAFMSSAAKTGVLALLCIAGTTGAVSAQVVNGDFETPVVPTSPGFVTYTPTTEPAGFGWDVIAGDIDHISPALWEGDPGQSIDLNGNTSGTIGQSIATTIGETYLISFSLAGNPDQGIKEVLVSFGGTSQTFTFNTAGRSTQNMGWVTETLTAAATSGSTLLTFQSLTSGSAGPAIDTVRVTSASAAAAPEPGTIALLGTGLLGMVGIAARKRFRA